VVGDFANERRVIVRFEDIPEVLRQAIVSAEDGNFFNHSGVSPTRILATAVRRGLRLQSAGGASTITQQLTRKLFLTDEQTLSRKIREWILAVQIEKRYTKEEILTMYCNQIYWGHGAYGVEAASRLYFGKSAKDLTLGEAAMIAGIIQGNVRQSPYVNMAAAVRRRNYTLSRMADEGYITQEVSRAEQKLPIVTRGEPGRPPSIAPYFLEAIRIQLEERYGSRAVYEGGLQIRTGLDATLQQATTKALNAHLRKLDKLQGYRRPSTNILEKGDTTLEKYDDRRWREPAPGDIQSAVVMGFDGESLVVRIGEWTGTIARSGYQWTRRRRATDVARAGDLVEVDVLTADVDARRFTARLEQAPAIQGAAVAIENRTGQILAMSGGANFERTQFNRATQALRQVGSLFKPFVFTAAIDRGYTAQSMVSDVPTSFDAGPDQPPYEPQNYDREFKGDITLREALEGSRNIPAVRIMEALGPGEVIKFARMLGVSSPMPPYLSLAIGSGEATLIEMVSAYSAYPNQGVRMEPRYMLEVKDRAGNTIEQHRPEPREAIRADTAYIITSLLEGAVQHGTAAAARSLDWPLGGKTGTTDDYTDAWFIGFDPDITLGIWVGYDQKRTIGHNQTGTVAALPIWMDIMKPWIESRRAALESKPEFIRPGNVVTVITPKGPEVFISGTEPGGR
jgi:penicillin-binding protein 1A